MDIVPGKIQIKVMTHQIEIRKLDERDVGAVNDAIANGEILWRRPVEDDWKAVGQIGCMPDALMRIEEQFE